MNSFKAWLLRWLGGISASEFAALHYQYRSAISRLKNDQDAKVNALIAEQESSNAELIQELNKLRNAIPATAAQDAAKPAVRVLRNFREFRSIVENKPIRIERTH